jgi:hypothetical protein
MIIGRPQSAKVNMEKEAIADRAPKRIFVAMPLGETESRDKVQLTSFYNSAIKNPIEANTKFQNIYTVHRSEKSFDITASIIKDVVTSDIVIADLSGVRGNPNVMYELGVRLSTSHRPVILIREKNPENKKIFDVQGFYCEEYDPLATDEITKYIVHRIHSLEIGEDIYRSPVLDIMVGTGAAVFVDDLIRSDAKHLMRVGQEFLACHSRLVREVIRELRDVDPGKEIPDDPVEIYSNKEIMELAARSPWKLNRFPIVDLPNARLFYMQDMLQSLRTICPDIAKVQTIINSFYLDLCLFRTRERVQTIDHMFSLATDIATLGTLACEISLEVLRNANVDSGKLSAIIERAIGWLHGSVIAYDDNGKPVGLKESLGL